jgi:Tfp pilus assembly protein PilX
MTVTRQDIENQINDAHAEGKTVTKTFEANGDNPQAPDSVEPRFDTISHMEEEVAQAKIAEAQKKEFGASSAELETRESGETMEDAEYHNPGETLPETTGRTVEGVEGEVKENN